jgi:hypothetical protein
VWKAPATFSLITYRTNSGFSATTASIPLTGPAATI